MLNTKTLLNAKPNWDGPNRGDSGGEPDMTNWSWYPIAGDETFCVVASIYDDDEASPDILLYNPFSGYESEPFFGIIEDVSNPVELFEAAEGMWRGFVENYEEDLSEYL